MNMQIHSICGIDAGPEHAHNHDLEIGQPSVNLKSKWLISMNPKSVHLFFFTPTTEFDWLFPAN
jgi:hypothetical protein